MSTSVNKRMHMINELCKMSLCKVMIVFTYLLFDVDKLFLYSIMNDGTLGLHPIKENTRMREKMNFDENSGSYYFLH